MVGNERSGNWGYAGRPGEIGGSSGAGGGGAGVNKSERVIPARKVYIPVNKTHAELSEADTKIIERRYNEALDKDNRLTNLVMDCADNSSGTCVGLEYRVKSQESMKDEINLSLREQKGATVGKVLENFTDLNRFTITWDDDNYTDGVKDTLKTMNDKGYTIYNDKQRNYWGNPTYKGYNVVFTNGNDTFEVQFHTPKSFKVKMENHKPFEIVRNIKDPLKDAQKYSKYTKWMMKNSNENISIPPGVDTLPGVKK